MSDDTIDTEAIEEDSNLDKGKSFLEREQHAQRYLGSDISELKKKKKERERVVFLEQNE